MQDYFLIQMMKKRIPETQMNNPFHPLNKGWFGFLCLLFSYTFPAQIYVSESASLYVHKNTVVHSDSIKIKSESSFPSENSKIYISKEALAYNVQAELVFLPSEKEISSKTKSHCIAKSRKSEKPIAKEQKTLPQKSESVYKPENSTGNFYFYALQIKSGVSSGSSFSGKKSVAADEADFAVLFSVPFRTQTVFFQELKIPVSYKSAYSIRPPPYFLFS
ncbi:MAG: hypothetical protein QM564_02850 [Bergeyella sp.]